jgi:hypothetical protein
MRDPRQWPAPWLFGLLILPLGIYVGFVWTALPLLLSQAGLTIGQIARIDAILQIPPILLFLWTPVVDVKLRRRTWLVLGALATALLFWLACQFGLAHVKLFTALLFFAGVVVALVPTSCGGLMATMLSVPDQREFFALPPLTQSLMSPRLETVLVGRTILCPSRKSRLPTMISMPRQIATIPFPGV